MAKAMAGSRGVLPSGPAPRLAIVGIIILAAVALALLPMVDRPVPSMPGIVAMLAVMLLVTELSTGFLLLVRFRAIRTWSLLVLASAYFYSGLMPVLNLLTQPGAILADRQLIETSPQSPAWICMLWINGFALMSFIAVVLEARFAKRRVATERLGRAVALAIGAAALAALAVFVVALAAADRLTELANEPGVLTDLGIRASWIGILFLAASIITILLVIRERNRLFLWLSLALLAMLFASLLVVTSGGRYTLAWFIGRLSWLVSGCALFIYLMGLHARDQRPWGRTRDLFMDATEGRAWSDRGETFWITMPETARRRLELEILREQRAALLEEINAAEELISWSVELLADIEKQIAEVEQPPLASRG